MKKQFFCLVFFFHFVSFAQTTSSSSVCTDVMIQTTNGKWIDRLDNTSNVSQVQKQEAFKRLDIFHDILQKMYPNPVGVDIRVYRSAGISTYGSTINYRYNQDNVLTYDYIIQPSLKLYRYFANFSPHYCSKGANVSLFSEGVTNENSDGIQINVNDFTYIMGDPSDDDDWTINGLPVKNFNTMIMEKWNGYELYGDVRQSVRTILIHREGMLPYIPITRKQYLDRCLVYTEKLHDQMIESLKQIPVRSLQEQEAEKNAKLARFEKDFGKDPKRLKSAVDYYLSGYKTDQQIQEENIANAKKYSEQAIKKFTDELENSARQGLLDSPALIRVMYISDPIFDTDPKTGYMLVTDNPDYLRKDLPAHVPQFIVLNWRWDDDYPPHAKYKKLLLENFPIEKLQAMIDK